MAGHIKLDRKILNWEWYNDYKMVHLFIHLLLKANWQNNKWQGIKVNRGQLITGVGKLSEKTGLTVSQTRSCLNRLQTTGEIAIKTTNKYSVITICKYEVYQSEKNENSKQTDKQNDTQDDKQNSKQIDNTIRKEEDNKIKKVNIYMPVAENFNGLPEIRIGAAIEFVRHTQRVDLDSKQVIGLWEVFKIQNLTGTKYYKDEDAVYGYFLNWIKTQKFNNGDKSNDGAKKSGTSTDRVAALKKW